MESSVIIFWGYKCINSFPVIFVPVPVQKFLEFFIFSDFRLLKSKTINDFPIFFVVLDPGSEMENPNPGSRINILDPQHNVKKWRENLLHFPFSPVFKILNAMVENKRYFAIFNESTITIFWKISRLFIKRIIQYGFSYTKSINRLSTVNR
jgi:hypothetical protein